MQIHDPDRLALLIIRRGDEPCEIKANAEKSAVTVADNGTSTLASRKKLAGLA